MSKPKLIAIDHDDYHGSHVGQPAGWSSIRSHYSLRSCDRDAGREFVALYLFDEQGCFFEARIDDLGTRAEFDEQRARNLFAQRLAELGPFEYGRIEVQPFEIDRFGTKFGLAPRPPEEDEHEWAVEVQPGNYMAFFEPWDSGQYDT